MTTTKMTAAEAVEKMRSAMRDAHSHRLISWAYSSEALKASDADHAALSTLSSLAEENAALRAEVERLRPFEAAVKDGVHQDTLAVRENVRLKAELDAARPLLKEREFILSRWPWIDYDPDVLAYRALKDAEGKEKT